MSELLIARSPDLRRLIDDGYHVIVRPSSHILVHEVPYVAVDKQVHLGTIVSTLETSGDQSAPPQDHTVWFVGQYPCDSSGTEIEGLRNGGPQQIDTDLAADFRFSAKPPSGRYVDYFDKITSYVAILEQHAQAVDPHITAKTFPILPALEDDAVFAYYDSASSRAGILPATRRLELSRIAIIGLGGTGSYVFDLVAKTPVREIHLFDPDFIYTHNAFRGPGGTTVDELRARPPKVKHWAGRFSGMRGGVVEHAYAITPATADELEDMQFVFLCIDAGSAKLPIVDRLEAFNIPFIDVGMGVSIVNDSLAGIVRTTTSLPGRRDAVRRRVSFADPDPDNAYDQNIQVVELNALNAALAVIRWKKHLGFYADYAEELHSTYTIDTNMLLCEEHDAV